MIIHDFKMSTKDKILEKINSNNSEDRYDILIDIGKQLLYDYEEYVFKMLSHEDEETRRAAIQVLGIYWSKESFIPKAEEMWLNDEDDLVRVTALVNWSSFFKNTNNSDVLEKLKIIFTTNEDVDMRIEALRSIHLVKNITISPETQKVLDRLYFDIQSFEDDLKLLDIII